MSFLKFLVVFSDSSAVSASNVTHRTFHVIQENSNTAVPKPESPLNYINDIFLIIFSVAYYVGKLECVYMGWNHSLLPFLKPHSMETFFSPFFRVILPVDWR